MSHPKNFKAHFSKSCRQIFSKSLFTKSRCVKSVNFEFYPNLTTRTPGKRRTAQGGFRAWGQNPIRQPEMKPPKFMGTSVVNFWWQKFRPPVTGSGRFLGFLGALSAPTAGSGAKPLKFCFLGYFLRQNAIIMLLFSVFELQTIEVVKMPKIYILHFLGTAVAQDDPNSSNLLVSQTSINGLSFITS